MNQLNQLQEKLQSNVISMEEQKALKGKRGIVFRGGYSNPGNPSDTGSDSPVRPSTSGSSTSNPISTTISSTTTNVVPTKYPSSKFI